MRIGLYHNLPSGGARRAMVEMVKGLVARGHMVDEYCPETADLTFLPLDGFVRQTVVLPYRPLGVAKKRVPMLTPYITVARLALDLRAIAKVGRQAAQHMSSQDYDLVFTHDCQLVLVPDVLRFLRQPGVHYFHVRARGPATERLWREPAAKPLERLKGVYYAPARWMYPWIRYRRARRNLKAARRVLTNSNFTASELRETFGVTSQTCYLGVDGARFRPLGLPRETFVLSAGTVHYHKGYRFLVEAIARLPEPIRPPLLIAANSEDIEERAVVESIARERHVMLEIVRVTNDEELVNLYNRAAAFVYAPIREPWGLVAIEAMACGTPVVAVQEGGVRESVVQRETGLVVDRDEQAFAEALASVLVDHGLARRLGEAGAVRARETFTWDRTVDCVESTLLRLSGASSRSA